MYLIPGKATLHICFVQLVLATVSPTLIAQNTEVSKRTIFFFTPSDNLNSSMPYQGQRFVNTPWVMHSIDPNPASGSDGVKLFDVNGDGFPDLVSGFEEAGVSRIYINPGFDNVGKYWDYVELPSPDVEDALLFDLDNNGVIDLVTASEGSINRIMFHWAPSDPDKYMDASEWQCQTIPVTERLSAWMFIVPMDVDGQNGIDLLVGSKRKREEQGDDKAVVGWLRSPQDPRDTNKWKYYPLSKAGWIMSMEVIDMNGDNKPDILISDRKFSTQTGVRWLENPGHNNKRLYKEWDSHMIGLNDGEPMFLTSADIDGDGSGEILVPDLSDGLNIFERRAGSNTMWDFHTVTYPAWAGTRGKAVAAGDINLDGHTDVVLSFEEDSSLASLSYEEYEKQGRHSVIWGSFQIDPRSDKWTFFKVSGLKGRKFDLVNLIDLDGDGDLDVLTNDENEEGDGLGVIWYENPRR